MQPGRSRVWRIAAVLAASGGGATLVSAVVVASLAGGAPWWPWAAAAAGAVLLALSWALAVTARLAALGAGQADAEAAARSQAAEAAPYHKLLQALPVPVALTRADDGLAEFLNSAAARQFDFGDAAPAAFYGPDYYADVRDRELLVARLQDQGEVTQFETRLLTQTGATFWAEVGARLVQVRGRQCILAVFQDVTARKELEASLRRMADTDPLTSLWNRRKFFERLAAEFVRLQRYDRPASVISIDLDHFKNLNDRYGHSAGDTILQSFASLVSGSLRATDLAARIGGEEFAVLLPETTVADARAVAEKLRAQVHEAAFTLDNGNAVSVTISLGVADMRPGTSGEAVMLAADQALYRAKAAGRDRVVVAEPGEAVDSDG